MFDRVTVPKLTNMRTRLYLKPTKLNIFTASVKGQVDSFTTGFYSTTQFIKNLAVVTKKVFML